MATQTVDNTTCSVIRLKEILVDPCQSQAFIDVRTGGEYKGSHISGVQNVPLSDIDKQAQRLSQYEEIYVSCHNGMRTKQAIKKLQSHGLNAIPVEGGIVAWRKAGFALAEGKRGAISVMRQVQIIFGLLALSGLLLSQFVHPAFIGLTYFVGIGLLIAGSTGWCGFAMVLDILPWNKA